MVVGDFIEESFSIGTVHETKALQIPNLLTLVEDQYAVFKQRRDSLCKHIGKIVSATKNQVIFRPLGDNRLLIAWADEMNAGEKFIWVETPTSQTDSLLVPVATLRQVEYAAQQEIDLMDVLKYAGTGILHEETDEII